MGPMGMDACGDSLPAACFHSPHDLLQGRPASMDVPRYPNSGIFSAKQPLILQTAQEQDHRDSDMAAGNCRHLLRMIFTVISCGTPAAVTESVSFEAPPAACDDSRRHCCCSRQSGQGSAKPTTFTCPDLTRHATRLNSFTSPHRACPAHPQNSNSQFAPPEEPLYSLPSKDSGLMGSGFEKQATLGHLHLTCFILRTEKLKVAWSACKSIPWDQEICAMLYLLAQEAQWTRTSKHADPVELFQSVDANLSCSWHDLVEAASCLQHACLQA